MLQPEYDNVLKDVTTALKKYLTTDGHPQPSTALTIKALGMNGQIELSWVTDPLRTVLSQTTGRDGVDANGFGVWTGPESVNIRKRVFLNLVNGTKYNVKVTVVYTDGTSDTVTGVATPLAVVVIPPVDPPTNTGDRRIPLVGVSGLKFNSLIFKGGSPNLARLKAAGTFRGRAYDGEMFFLSRGSWSDFQSSWGDSKLMLDAGLLVVARMPHAPEGLGKNINQDGFVNKFAAEQRAFGAWLVKSGMNKPNLVLSVDWEFNGDWYNWSGNYGGPLNLKIAIANFVVNVRLGGATEVKFDMCMNKGPSQTGHDLDCFPGEAYIDSLSVDWYDQWNPIFTPGDMARELAKSPSPQSIRDFVRKDGKGVMHGLSEGGNTNPKDANHGGANPAYWENVGAWYNDPKNNVDCSWHVTYDHAGDPPTLHHELAYNAAALSSYKKYFGDAG